MQRVRSVIAMTYETYEPATGRQRPRLAWSFIFGLGALALAEPVVHAMGLLESMHPAARHFATLAAVSAVWLVLIAYVRPSRPFLTVMAAGLVYIAVIASAGLIVGPVLGMSDGSPGLWVFPIAVISMASTHLLWFALVGGIAQLIGAKGAGRNQ